MFVAKFVGTKLLVASVLFLGMSDVHSSEETDVKIAQEHIAHYKSLRRSCSVAKGEERKACFSELREASEAYKKAKRFLAAHKPAGSYKIVGKSQ